MLIPIFMILFLYCSQIYELTLFFFYSSLLSLFHLSRAHIIFIFIFCFLGGTTNFLNGTSYSFLPKNFMGIQSFVFLFIYFLFFFSDGVVLDLPLSFFRVLFGLYFDLMMRLFFQSLFLWVRGCKLNLILCDFLVLISTRHLQLIHYFNFAQEVGFLCY